jgi:ABC-type microcin C transport system permease subunit YejE
LYWRTYQDGKVIWVRRNRQIDTKKLEAIREAKSAGETQSSVSARLVLPNSTVGRFWLLSED